MVDFKDLTVKIIKEEGNRGEYEISPLPTGYGNTLANALRRILLSSIEGAAVTSVRVNGVDHEYTTLEGIKEDVIELIMNIKALDFSCMSDEPQVCTLSAKGKKKVTGKDIETTGAVEVVSPDAHIATLTAGDSELEIELVVEKGVGYRAAEETRTEMGRIPVDADFSPIKLVRPDVTSARKGQSTNLDAVVIEVESNGSIAPIDALLNSARILQEFAGKVMGALGVPVEEVDELAESSRTVEMTEEEEEAGISEEVLAWKVEDLPISKRSKSGLLSGGYETIGDLRDVSATDLLNLSGFGNKSLSEIIDLLGQYGIELKSE